MLKWLNELVTTVDDGRDDGCKGNVSVTRRWKLLLAGLVLILFIWCTR